MGKFTSVLTIIGITGLMAGCGSNQAAAPVPTPSYSCTPDASGAPCTAELAAAQAEEAKAYDEAVHAYREFTKERNRLVVAGGAAAPTPEMTKYASGQYLGDVASDLALLEKHGYHGTSGLEIMQIVPVSATRDSVVLRICENGSHIKLLSESGQTLGAGNMASVEIKVNRGEGAWRVSEGNASKEDVCGL
ncbi:hypothetical protein Rai3103_03330 [Raineyella fluvialis]|uniref:Lipoprotein n=2 Tax=Raineyella fluvialis TaxID=2662261 RepID=A0A5Q2F8T1_9ACTN|nr:hypothetical protein Rai3103_03330 [Raineyella fluvialis]